MAERMHAGRSHDEVQAGGKQRSGQQVDRQHRDIRAAGSGKRQQQQADSRQPGSTQQQPARGAKRRLDRRAVAAGRLRPPHQAPGPPHQHDSHHQKLSHQRELGKTEINAKGMDRAQSDAHRLDLSNQQRGDIGAGDRAHAADHDDDECVANGQQVEVERGRLARQLQRAAQAREHRAEREHTGEQPGLVHAERTDHLAILRRRAHQHAPAGALEQQPQRAQHQRASDDQQQIVAGKAPAQDVDRTGQPRRTGSQQILGPPQPQRRVLDHQHQREGREQLEQLGRAVDPAQHDHLDQRADRTGGERRQRQCGPKAQPRAQALHQAVGDVDAQHEKRTVGEIDDARDTEDQRQPGRDQEQRRRAGQAVEQLNQ